MATRCQIAEPVKPMTVSTPKAAADRFECALGRPVVVGDLAGVHLVRVTDADLVEHVEDRVPALGEVLESALDHRRGHRREHRERVPDRRAGEADDGVHAEPGGSARRVLDLLSRTLADALGLAVAPDAGRQDALVPLVDRVVADRLAGQVAGDRPDAELVAFHQRLAAHGLLGRDVVLDDRAQDFELAVVQRHRVSPGGPGTRRG